MTLRFTTTDAASRITGVKVLVHGRAGSGKTPLCATAPNPLILSAEAGLLSLRQYQIPTILISDLAELDEAYQFCRYSEHARQFETVCLDSISEIAEDILADRKPKEKDPRRAYGDMFDQVLERLKWFRDLPDKHIYFSAKQAYVKDELTGGMIWGPSMPGRQLGPALPYMFDEIFSLEVARGVNGAPNWNYLRTARDPMYEARDRSGVLDPIEEPNLTKIFNKIMRVAA